VSKLATVVIRTYSGPYKGRKYDRTRFFVQNMESILTNTLIDARFVVIDDASPYPKQQRYLEKLAKDQRVEVIVKPQNKGRLHSFAMMRRIAAKSSTPYAYLCDDDYTYHPGWLGELIGVHACLSEAHERPIGLVSGFHREGFRPSGVVAHFSRYTVGMTKNWVGLHWLQSRECLRACGHLELAPTHPFPEEWTQPWISDGAYQYHVEACGFTPAYVVMAKPSLIDHIGEVGLHSSPKNYVKGES